MYYTYSLLQKQHLFFISLAHLTAARPRTTSLSNMHTQRIVAFLIAIYIVAIALGAFQEWFIAGTGLLRSVLQHFWHFLYSTKVWVMTTSAFLAVLGVVGYKPLKHMLCYFAARKTVLSLLFFLLYLVALLALLRSNLYPKLALLLVGFILLFPLLFPHEKIQNPTATKKSGLLLLGQAGQILPINAPELGVFVVGAPGCGKTKYVLEPLLFRMIAKGYSGILYDYDFSAHSSGKNYSLSQLAYHCCRNYTKDRTRFVSINFQDLTLSARINPIAPAQIQDRKQLSNTLHTLLVNMNPGLSQKEDFWYKNTYALLKGIVVFLANHYPQYCTFPHVVMLGLQSQESLFRMLQSDQEAKLYASPVFDAFENPGEQLAGVMANFKVALERLVDPQLFWVLSGDEVPHVVNDPEHPLVVCLGNTPTAKEVLSPVLSMMMASLIAKMYGHDRNPSFLMIDELPTLLLPHLSDVPATARKYGIATLVALQNLSQLERRYGRVGARELEDTFSNHLVGRSQLRLSKDLSDMFGRQEQQVSSQTISARQFSETVHKQEKVVMSPQELMNLGVGEFVGKVAASNQGFCKMKLQPIGAYDGKLHHAKLAQLPTTRQDVDAAANFAQIQETVTHLVGMHA